MRKGNFKRHSSKHSRRRRTKRIKSYGVDRGGIRL